jgi:hypothetical protein
MRYTDEFYPANIARCQHIKVNGTQCGSPALKRRRLCHFHDHWQQLNTQRHANAARRGAATPILFPILEDATSIQLALAHVMQMLLNGQIEHKTASLLFYALQTASANLRLIDSKPQPEEIVFDRSTIADNLLGDKAWYKQEFVDLQNEDGHAAEENDEELDEGTIQAVGCPAPRASCDEWARKNRRNTDQQITRPAPSTTRKEPRGLRNLPITLHTNRFVSGHRFSDDATRTPSTAPLGVAFPWLHLGSTVQYRR